MADACTPAVCDKNQEFDMKKGRCTDCSDDEYSVAGLNKTCKKKECPPGYSLTKGERNNSRSTRQ